MRAAFALCGVLVLALGGSAVAATAKDSTETALDRCLDSPAGVSTAGMVDCYAAAAKTYDGRMNRAYAGLMKVLPQAAKAKLQTAQRQWLVFHDAERQARSALYATRQGTMYVPMQVAAESILIRDRALELESHLRVFDIED